MIFFIQAFILGLLFNAAPGVVFTETIKRGINGGFFPALYVQIGSLAGDALWAILGLLGIGILLNIDILKYPLSIIGIIYLIYLAYDSFISSNIKYEKIVVSKSIKNNALKSGIFLSITNPQNIAYWAALGSSFGALGIAEPQTSHYFIFFFGFISSSILWCFVCALAVEKIFKYTNSVIKKYIFRICTIVFLYLAVGTFYNLI
ncbi:MAG: LysE family transporter [Candidatus Puniceispirillales bacterium]|tara:strand:+ start:1348 stop:1959 length:612 start_codon:yes stop_codon:yes gene_type:complete